MSTDRPVRILLVEDHALFRRGLRRLLTEHGFDVVGEAGNGQAGARLAEELAPDVVFMDLHMPVMDGVAATREITGRTDAPRILMLTISAEDEDVVDALMAGASGYLLKDAEPDAIAAAARAAAEGEVTIATSTAGALVDRLRETAPSEQPGEIELTDRERDVLALLVEGHENAEIARRLFLSPSTVKTHVSSILEKFAVDSRVQAAVHAVRSGMV